MQGQKNNPHYQALDILSRRDHSEYEVRQKLKRKNFPVEQINNTIDKLKRQRLLDDSKFAVLFCNARLAVKPVGPRFLRAKLQQKGIADHIIDDALAEAYPPGREEELAKQAAAAWRQSHPLSSPEPASQRKYQQRLARHLASRGFSQASYSLFDGWMGSE